jgi:PKD repeat protein
MKQIILLVALFLTLGRSGSVLGDDTEQWDIFELTLEGPSNGNPFVDVKLSAEFRKGDKIFRPEGFYDGKGVYKVRFMPKATGKWTYLTKSNRRELDGKKGNFTCIKEGPGNHGPVRVHNTFQLAYDDGTPHFSVGTTCYAWVHQGDMMEAQTLETLKNAPFNKMRMCVFPKAYTYNKNEPEYYAYAGKPLKDWDFKRFNPAFWHHFEKRVRQLRDMGIEADIIIFHPYDRWGFKDMGHQNNLFYLRYLVARLAAYRNVWWSFANEYDLLKWPMEHWDEYMKLVQQIDPYNHLRGIHNCRGWYDHNKPWVTHCSIQNSDFRAAGSYRDKYHKPVVYDECRYEGNIPQGWGNITAEQMTRNFWMGSLAGCYVGHGETYKHPQDLLWWAKGGVLRGQSPARIQFMKDIIEELPYQQMQPDFSNHPDVCILAKKGQCYLMYFAGKKQVTIDLPGDRPYKVDGIDTWEMKILPIGSAGAGKFTYAPPKNDYALRLTRYAPGEKIRPQAKATADKTEGIAPLTVKFSTPWEQKCRWDFGGTGSSTERSPVHTFKKPGIYTVTLTITDTDGATGCTTLAINVDRNSKDPIVKFGFAEGDYPKVTLHGGQITKSSDGTYDLSPGEPFTWIKVGDEPIKELEGIQSFTIAGWLNASGMKVGSGGNRILFSLQRNHSGIDLVHHSNGAMRLAVNEWPDSIRNDSSKGKVRIGKWIFFAVTYDASKQKDSVCWYFGDESTPAELDRKTNYNSGPVDQGSGNLVIGNFNKTLQGAGLDRQFRGRIRGFQIYASRLGARGALSLEKIRDLQKMR